MPTQETFTAAMRAAVEDRGAGFIYPADDPEWVGTNGCRYRTTTGQPACIVGAALQMLGLLERLDVSNTQGAFQVLRGLGFDRATARAADAAQGIQDMGENWGEALQEYFKSLTAESSELAA
jgi:hypothetical protein